MQLKELNDFYLVGGTALSLYYGHRQSIDLDLFATKEFANEAVLSALAAGFSDLEYSNPNNPIGLFTFISGVKVDLVKHHYFRLIDQPVIADGIRILGVRDLMAMKIAAILKRGVKKDFWDVAELLQHYTLEDFISAYNLKYPNRQVLISIPQALTYYADAEESEDPISAKGQTWKGVKKVIQQAVGEYLK
jgi:predicted nucleotidyltransferase component of viral defense system